MWVGGTNKIGWKIKLVLYGLVPCLCTPWAMPVGESCHLCSWDFRFLQELIERHEKGVLRDHHMALHKMQQYKQRQMSTAMKGEPSSPLLGSFVF